MPKNKPKYAIAVGIFLKSELNDISLDEELNELEGLATTLGIQFKEKIYSKINKINASTYIGSGKLKEIMETANFHHCDTIIFNEEISPNHYKNIKKINKKINILDRTSLILNIFTKHAKTKESRIQVELANLQYMLPRLTRLWTHLERQMGGVGTRGGPGETQIEIDRRLIRGKIKKLKFDLNKIEKQKIERSKGRSNSIKVSLVGYTNSGKSTLMRSLTNSKVLVKNQLFSTLDTTTKSLFIKSNIKVLISDTVGFIQKLPHYLVASFKSTLKESLDADIIIKVFDASSKNLNTHILTVEEVLKDLNIKEKSIINVFNKIDKVKNIKGIKSQVKIYSKPLMISALNEIKINTVLSEISSIAKSLNTRHTFKLNQNQSHLLRYIYSKLNVLSQEIIKNKYFEVLVEDNKNLIKSVESYIKKYS